MNIDVAEAQILAAHNRVELLREIREMNLAASTMDTAAVARLGSVLAITIQAQHAHYAASRFPKLAA